MSTLAPVRLSAPAVDRPPLRAPRTGVWRGRPALAALGVILVMVVSRAVLMRDSYFNQDDFYLTARGARSDLSIGFLFEPFAGHIIPAQQLNFWLVGNLAPFQWAVVATEVVLLQLLATVVMWHLLTRLLPGRWVRVPLLAVFAWTPLTLMTTLWWSAAIALWPHVLSSLLAVLFLVRARQGAGRTWVNLAASVAWIAFGLLWHERAVLIAPVLFGVAVCLAGEARGWRKPVAAVRRFWQLWLAIVVGLGAYLVAHQQVTTVEGGSGSVKESLGIARSYVFESIVPGLASGPWQAQLKGGAVIPPPWVTIVSLVLFGLVLLLVLWRGGPARFWAFGLLVGYVLADLLLLVAGRGGFGSVIGLDPRYASDVVHVAVPALALALRGAPPGFGFVVPQGRSWRWRRSLVLGLGTALYLVGSAFGSAVLVPHFQNTGDRAYVTNLRTDLAADPNQVIVDELVPPEVVLPLVGRDALVSQIFASLPEAPVFDLPSARLRTIDDEGHLNAVELAGVIPMKPGPVADCGYPVKSAGRSVPLAVGIQGPVLLRLGYFTDQESTIAVTVGEWRSEFLAQPGPNEMWLPVPAADEDVEVVNFRVSGPGTLCVAELEAGLPESQ